MIILVLSLHNVPLGTHIFYSSNGWVSGVFHKNGNILRSLTWLLGGGGSVSAVFYFVMSIATIYIYHRYVNEIGCSR